MQQRQGQQGRFAVLVLAGVLCVGAAALIVKVLGHSNDGQAAGEVIYIALVLTIFGACAMAGVNLAVRRPRWALVGWVTAAIAVLGFAALAIKLGEGAFFLGGGNWHLQGVGIALTLSLAQVSIVLAYDSAEDSPLTRAVSLLAIGPILILGVLAAIAAADSDVSISERVYAVLAVLYLLGAALWVLFRLFEWQRRRGRVGSVPLDHVVIAVSDRERAVRFYTSLLGAEVVPRPEGRIALRVGEQLLNVHEPGLAATALAGDPVRPGNSDLCFAWPASPQLAIELVRTLGAELVEGPVSRVGARGPGQSVYCRDPDGSLIELISYG